MLGRRLAYAIIAITVIRGLLTALPMAALAGFLLWLAWRLFTHV